MNISIRSNNDNNNDDISFCASSAIKLQTPTDQRTEPSEFSSFRLWNVFYSSFSFMLVRYSWQHSKEEEEERKRTNEQTKWAYEIGCMSVRMHMCE